MRHKGARQPGTCRHECESDGGPCLRCRKTVMQLLEEGQAGRENEKTKASRAGAARASFDGRGGGMKYRAAYVKCTHQVVQQEYEAPSRAAAEATAWDRLAHGLVEFNAAASESEKWVDVVEPAAGAAAVPPGGPASA